jgi:UDP-N-acetylmuramoyl-tripeptide--D-alanyl-D-alanine ligase
MISRLWNIEEILKAVSGKLLGNMPSNNIISGIAFDNREVREGDLFIALPGTQSDGHSYVIDALKRGAAAALVARALPYEQEKTFADQLIRVVSVPKALESLAKFARQRMSGKIIGITGSAGKTSTKDALYKTLGRSGFVHASEKSYNNHVGVPVSLARMPANANFGVFELGMSAGGEIEQLSAMVQPNIAIITSIGLAHSASFSSLKEIALAKAEIFKNLTKDGIVILPQECAHFDTLLLEAHKAGVSKVITTSIKDENADVYVERMAVHENCTCMTVNVFGKRFTFKIGLPGIHWVSNSLNVLAAVHLVGGDLGLAGVALGEMHGVAGRGVQHFVNMSDAPFTLVDDSYNANPISMQASLNVLGGMKVKSKMGCRIAVLGDMEELGDISSQAHSALKGHLAKAGVQKLFAYGPAMEKLCDELGKQSSFNIQIQSFSSKSELLDSLKRQIRHGDIVLVKGSNSQKLSQIVEGLLALHQAEDEDGWQTPSSAAE